MRLTLPLLLLAVACGDPDKDDTAAFVDEDGDGWEVGEDCDDTDPEVHPNAVELCDGIDNDCDGEIDGTEASGGPVWFADADEDGYGDPADQLRACEQPSGYVSNDSDCDDLHTDAYPGAAEYCDGYDNDCDDQIDEPDAVDATTWYADGDGDGFGSSVHTEACEQPTGYVAESGDCNDATASAFPGNDEICDGLDNDCDGERDEPDAIDAVTWFLDADDDEYGDASSATTACTRPEGHCDNADDCDDGDPNVNPSRLEECDGVDNDCDELVDEADAVDADTWYADADGDGFGDAASTQDACEQPSGHVAVAMDCDDSDAAINPEADEICDGVDNDCSSYTSEDGLVTLDGVESYPRLQNAVDAASSGSTIVACDGTYVETLVIEQDVTIVSLNGSGATEIDANNDGAAVVIQGGVVTLEGFTLSGGSGANNPYGGVGTVGGGVFVFSNDPVTIQDCVISNNDATFGGGLLLGTGSDVTILDTEIENNWADEMAGGIYASGDVLVMDGVDVLGNDASRGGGMVLDDGEASVTSCLVDDNTADMGGGLYVNAATLLGSATTVSDNMAYDLGGGLMVYNEAVVSGLTVNNNEANFGAGMALWGSTGAPTISDIIATRNDAVTSAGGMWIFTDAGDVTVTDVSLTDNVAGFGAGMSHEGGAVTMSACAITDNASTSDGGGAYLFYGATLVSDVSDWGDSSTGDDNSPDDVYLDALFSSYDGYGGAASFTCDDSGCY
jgi:hypothetical protein